MQQAPTVAELATRYLDEHAEVKKKPESIRHDAFNLRLHVLPALGKHRVAAVTRADIAALHHWLPDSKTGAKVIYLSPPARDVLAGMDRQDSNPYVSVGRKPGSHLVNLRKPWGRLRAKAGLPDLRLHDLRHSFASVGATLGLSLPMIGKLLGHTHAATTQRYAHLAADPVKQAMDQVGATLALALQGRPNGEAFS